ncbi:MAG: tetratricopeptide repeat protein [Flavobacteriaceae bacterium]
MKALKIILLFFLPTLIWSQTSFDRANELYEQENFEEAAQAYEELLASGQHSADVYFNLGNAYYKLSQIAPSIYNYERALLLEPNNKNVQTNLKFARNMTIDEIKEAPKVGIRNWLSGFTSVYHYDVWAKIAVGFSVLCLLGFVGYYFARKIILKRISFALMLVFLLTSVLSVMLSVFEKNRAESYNPAIVFAETVSVKGEPQTLSANVVTLHEGTKVYILENLDEWFKVELADGTQGWVEKETVRSLKF